MLSLRGQLIVMPVALASCSVPTPDPRAQNSAAIHAAASNPPPTEMVINGTVHPIVAATTAITASALTPASASAEVTPAADTGDSYNSAAGVATSAFGTQNALDLTSFGQGDSGDCGAISGILAVAAAMPQIITSNINYLGSDSSGIDTYAVKLFINDTWQNVVVNASTPNDAAHVNGDDGAYWGPLYEKALAYAAGGYENLIGINTTTVMTLLTSLPASQNPGGGQAGIAALTVPMPETVVGVSAGQGYYDVDTGDSVGNSTNAVYIHDQHYYAVAGFVDSSQQTVVMFNPWNQSAGEDGQFTLTTQAFAKIFWAYSMAMTGQ